MNIFKGKIYCKNCGKRYNFKLDHNIPIYICSGYKNYGSAFCPRNMIYESDLINIVLQHLKLHSIVNVPYEELNGYTRHIEAQNGIVMIEYTDGSKSEWTHDKITY